MTEREIPGRTAADTRLAWTIGGALLIVSPALSLGSPSIGSQIPGGNVIGPVCFAAATILFAFGIRGSGSVTARRPLGTTALVFLGVWTLLTGMLLYPVIAAIFATSRGGVQWTLTVSYANDLLQFVAALIAAVQIARAGVVPRPWNWAPTWVLAAITAPWMVLQIVGWVGGPFVAPLGFAFSMIDGLISIAASMFLGVVAIVLGQLSVRTAGDARSDSDVVSRPPRNGLALLLLAVGGALMAGGVATGLVAQAAADRASRVASGMRTLPVNTYAQFTSHTAVPDFTGLWIGGLLAVLGLVVVMAGVVALTRRPETS